METITLEPFEGHAKLAEAGERRNIAEKAYEEALERYILERERYTQVLDRYFPDCRTTGV